MKYFVDFEATQFTQEIISIGCVREDGESFYSLVRPVEEEVNQYITDLTGITQEMVGGAPSAAEVFESFYDWAFRNDNAPDFFVWGNADVDFLRHTFKRTNSVKARMTIGYLCGSIRDYAKVFCKKIKNNTCPLIKAYNQLFNLKINQTHDALEDAIFLFAVYDMAENMPINELRTFFVQKNTPTSKISITPWNKMGFAKGTICAINEKKIALMHFINLDEAANWILENKISFSVKEKTSVANIRNNIKKAYSSGNRYQSMFWRIVP